MQRSRAKVAAGLVGLSLVSLLAVHQLSGLSFGQDSAQVQRRRLTETADSTCLKEAQCPQHSSCGQQIQTGSLPFSLEYAKSTSNEATTFTFKVCSTECHDLAACKPLERFLLRLDSNLLANTEFLKSVSPAGSISQCSEAAGLGYSWSGNQLAALQFHDPAQGAVCQDFSLEIYHESDAFTNLWLTDICQQSTKFVSADGTLSEPQASLADIGSCIAKMTLEDGASAFQLLADQDFTKPVEPSAGSELSTEIHRVMAELEGPRRQLLQAPGYYGYSSSPAPYGYYGSPTPSYGSYGPQSPPSYGPSTPAAPSTPAYAPTYGSYGTGYSSYGYGSYGAYGSYAYGSPAPKASPAPSPPASTPVPLFGPISG